MESKVIKVEGYLTEKKLGEVLAQITEFTNLTAQPYIPGTKLRADYSFEFNGLTYLVEFDGFLHYTNLDNIIRDNKVRDIVWELDKQRTKYRLVRIPFFVQLTTETLEYFFSGITGYKIDQDFPHGFITCKQNPRHFHIDGYFNYLGELEDLPQKVSEEIIDSVVKRVMKSTFGEVEYYPRELFGVFQWMGGVVKSRLTKLVIPDKDVYADSFSYSHTKYSYHDDLVSKVLSLCDKEDIERIFD